MEGRALARLFNMPDRRCADPRFDRADVSYLSEEMLEWGLDPTVIDEEAFLKARDTFIQGTIELEDVPRLARKFQDEYDARDLAIALSLLPR